MNTRFSTPLVLLAALSALALAPLSAATKNVSPVAYTVKTLTATKEVGQQIERGTSRSDFARAMQSKAHQELSPDVWVYPRYHANLDRANEQGCDNLVVTFAHGKVVDMKLVNTSGVSVIASQRTIGSGVTRTASK